MPTTSTTTATVQIHVLAGAQAGRTFTLQQSAFTFGRTPDNTICLDLETVSRQHGEIKIENNHWTLHNHSANGTIVNKKRVTKKSYKLGDQNTIIIGDQRMFEITCDPIISDATASNIQDDAETPDKQGNKRRFKIYAILGAIYMAIILGLFMLLSSMSSSPSSSIADIQSISPALIAKEIQEPLAKRVPDARLLQRALDTAQEQLALRDTEPDALYKAHVAFKQALSYATDSRLSDPFMNRLQQQTREDFTGILSQQIQSAHDHLKAKEYRAAAAAYQRIAEMYPASNSSSVYDRIQHNWAVAKKNMQKR
ncbi:FHA domain-containing protein [Poriferisphaera sp. WC338]|uniref:FHA domain-containing protein n=1 Tax=Poriferisphaera sp. WC338 TaxID=3425129 RepID=UPI003D81740C